MLISGKFQAQLKDFYEQLLTSHQNFEQSVEDSDLKQEAFLAIIQQRDHLFEQIFYKSFKPHHYGIASNFNLPDSL